MSVRTRFWLFAFSLIAFPGLAFAQGYTVTPLNIPGCIDTRPTGINDKNQIVFTCTDAAGTHHAGLWRTDWFDPIEIEGAWMIGPSKTNHKRRTVGSYIPADLPGKGIGFKTQGEEIFTIEVPGAEFTAPAGINDSDEVAGDYMSMTGYVGFLRTGWPVYTFHPVIPPWGRTQHVTDVNNSKLVYGFFTDWADQQHGFIYNHEAKTYRQIDVPGAYGTRIHGANDKGQYVGQYWDGARWRGFLYNGKTYLPIGAAGDVETSPRDINNQGTVVGYTWDPLNHIHLGFTAKPTPAVASR